MSVYLDASLLVALFTQDRFAARAEAFVRKSDSVLLVSDFAAAEFASALSRFVRMRELAPHHARTAFSGFDEWTNRTTQRVELIGGDIPAAERYLRRLDLTLRTPDALNIAISQRLDATLATFDANMSASARALGVAIAAV